MDSENADRRVRKTKKQLRQGLTKLLEQKSAKDITVRELSDLVDINVLSALQRHLRYDRTD